MIVAVLLLLWLLLSIQPLVSFKQPPCKKQTIRLQGGACGCGLLPTTCFPDSWCSAGRKKRRGNDDEDELIVDENNHQIVQYNAANSANGDLSDLFFEQMHAVAPTAAPTPTAPDPFPDFASTFGSMQLTAPPQVCALP